MGEQDPKKGERTLWRVVRQKARALLAFVFNPRLLLCFGIGWMITNGWAYILLGLGTYLGSAWMVGISGFYMSLLWFPFTPEKIITVLIAIWLMTRLFPNDQKTLAVLRVELHRLKEAVKKRKNKKKTEKPSAPENN